MCVCVELRRCRRPVCCHRRRAAAAAAHALAHYSSLLSSLPPFHHHHQQLPASRARVCGRTAERTRGTRARRPSVRRVQLSPLPSLFLPSPSRTLRVPYPLYIRSVSTLCALSLLCSLLCFLSSGILLAAAAAIYTRRGPGPPPSRVGTVRRARRAASARYGQRRQRLVEGERAAAAASATRAQQPRHSVPSHAGPLAVSLSLSRANGRTFPFDT